MSKLRVLAGYPAKAVYGANLSLYLALKYDAHKLYNV